MMNGKLIFAHRVSYLLAHGEWPDCTDHLCRNRLCQNPAHLESVTVSENVKRGEGMMARNAHKTHCKRGHPLNGENVIVVRGSFRSCRECDRINHREVMRRRRRAAGVPIRGNRIADQ